MARRPRLYWVSWELTPDQGVSLTSPDSSSLGAYGTISLKGEFDSKDYFTPGWQRCGDEPLPTFTTARPRDHPGRRPAGLDLLTTQERTEWENDKFRFPPYQYQWKHYVTNGTDYRPVNPEEREVILGFPRGFTVQCLPKGQQGTENHQDLRLTLLGNTSCVTVIVWLLAQLCAPLGLCEPADPQRCIDITKPGSATELAAFLARPPMSRTTRRRKGGNALVLVKKPLNLVSIKGEDIILSASTEDNLKYHRLRASIPARLWAWRTVCSWLWKGNKEHINVLEMRAVLCALKWRIIKCGIGNHRLVHLVDSLVCLHSLTRHRTSSRKMRRTLAKINSLLLLSKKPWGMGLCPYFREPSRCTL